MADQLPRELMDACCAVAQDATFAGFDDSVLKEIFAGPHRRLFETVYRMGFELGWRIHEQQIAARVKCALPIPMNPQPIEQVPHPHSRPTREAIERACGVDTPRGDQPKGGA